MYAVLAQAKAKGLPIHKPEFYGTVTREQMEDIFKSDTHVQMSLLEKRRSNLHEAAAVLNQVTRKYESESVCVCAHDIVCMNMFTLCVGYVHVYVRVCVVITQKVA